MNGTTKVCGILGYPVGHSLSPLLHNLIAERMGQNLVYVPFETAPENLDAAVKGAWALNLLGLNVTVPHKEKVMDSLLGIDPEAKAIGAVNTLVRREGGFQGFNTDARGLKRSLQEAHVEVKGQECVLLGAGGAAKAAAYVLASMEAKRVWVLNRSLSKACQLAEEINQLFGREVMIPMELSQYDSLPQEENHLVVIQSTSVGMHPNVDQAVIQDPAFYQRIKVGFDIVYTPEETKFMKLVKQQGGRALGGLDMLLYQGVIAYELWNPGVRIDEETIALAREKMKEALGQTKKKNVILIGFMGAGKTSVADYLGTADSMEVVDTDQRIEQMAGMEIKDIFASQGEEAFRRLETQMLRELLQEPDGRVISVGGGLPLRQENRELLKKLGYVVCLDVTVDTVLERLGEDVSSRPMLSGGDVRARAQELMDQRRDIYLSAADMVEDVNGKSVAQIGGEIRDFFKSLEKRA